MGFDKFRVEIKRKAETNLSFTESIESISVMKSAGTSSKIESVDGNSAQISDPIWVLQICAPISSQ